MNDLDPKHRVIIEKQVRKMRQPALAPDLFQIGALALLEALDRGITEPGYLGLEVKEAIHRFVSFGQSPVSIPDSSKTQPNAKAIRAGEDKPVGQMTQRTFDQLRLGITGAVDPIDEYEQADSRDIESNVWVRQVWQKAEQKLNATDFSIFDLRFGPADLTQREVADRLQMTLRNVQMREHAIKRKLGMLK